MRQHSRVSISTVVAVIVVVVIIVVAAGAYVLLTNTQPSTSTNTQASTTDTNTQSSTSLSNANIVLGTLPTADNVPLFIADQEGYFAQQGINLTIKFMAGGAVIAPAVQQGSIQIGLSSVTPLMSAVEQGFNFKFIAPIDAYDFPNSSQLTTYVPGFSTHALTVLTSSNITTWKDLSGKTIAESTLGSAAESYLEQSLELNGVNVSSVHFVAIPINSQLSALEQHRVDAVDLFEPYATQMFVANETAPTTGAFHIIGDPSHITTTLMISGYFSTQSWINSNPAVVKGFNTALQKGVQLAKTNETLARQVLVTYLKMDQTVADKVVMFNYVNAPLPASSLQYSIGIGLKFGLLQNPNDIASQLVDPSYFELTS